MKKVNTFHLLPTSWQGDSATPYAAEYSRAFSKAVELDVVSAFLTAWPKELELSRRCKRFRLIIGTDFGTTRRKAILNVLQWLPQRFEGQVRAFNQKGVNFHPKAVLWREADGRSFLLIGSSNLTRAAFESNVEANATIELSPDEYASTCEWFDKIADKSLEVNKGWLKKYEEAPPRPSKVGRKKAPAGQGDAEEPVFDFSLELSGRRDRQTFAAFLEERRAQRAYFDKHSREPLVRLFRAAAAKRRWSDLDNQAFYGELQRLWAVSHATRLGGGQWVIHGKNADHRELARSLVAVLDAEARHRDAIVVREKDRLQELRLATRDAVFTELLCHLFPTRYPILDAPVQRWRSSVGFDRGVRGTVGARYIRLAGAMRAALTDAGCRDLGLKDLAELDALIWFKFRKT